MEKAVLVQRRLRNERSYLNELNELSKVAGYKVVGTLEQIRRPDPSYQIGYGKVKELVSLIRRLDASKVIFFNELKPVQVRNLIKELNVEVIDRFQLILEIFIKRAGTEEAKLQIELAQLKRNLSFVKDMISLSKRTEYPGFLSGGEYELNVYEQHIRKRIAKIERILEKIRQRKKDRYRKQVNTGSYTVTLTGYTGAGKTTLFNILAKEKKYIDGKPFATLSTVARRIKINGIPIILSDTIGFIDSLPPLLLDAFYTTLEEISVSDLILLLVDSNESLREIKRKLTASLNVLRQIGAINKPIIVVLNKIDLLDKKEILERCNILGEIKLPCVSISAKRKINLENLFNRIEEYLPEYFNVLLEFRNDDNNDFSVIRKLYENSKVIRSEYTHELIKFEVFVKKSWLISNLGFIEKNQGRIVSLNGAN